jgi:hypothetical protein
MNTLFCQLLLDLGKGDVRSLIDQSENDVGMHLDVS